jgi:nucleotide-binding universal stress UspA family protein
MKKFIAAFDGLRFSESTVDYAILMAKNCDAHLVGISMEDFTRHSYTAADVISFENSTLDKHLKELNEKDKEERELSIDIFAQACRKAGLNYSVHRDRNVALQDLLHESIYADLLIIYAGETMAPNDEPIPTRFIRSLLTDVQCPVAAVPSNFRPFDKIVLLYDGAPSSVYAVRTFSYLFDPIKYFETEVITVNEKAESLHLPDNRLIKEFIKRHYPGAKYTILKGEAEEEILNYMKREKSDPIIVLGAYRRGRLSRLFRASMADHLMQHVEMPLFIAHNKS